MFSKICASKLGVRLIYGCGLYPDVYGNYFLLGQWIVFVHCQVDTPMYVYIWYLSAHCTKQLLDEVEHDIMNYDNTDLGFDNS